MGRGSADDPQFFSSQEDPTVGLVPSHEDLLELVFPVCWIEHGGSGLNLAFHEAFQCTLSDLHWLRERATKERKAEAEAIRNASKRGH